MFSTLTTNIAKLFASSNRMVETKTAQLSQSGQPIKPLHSVAVPFEKATFGMGCFWGCDSLFGASTGVLRTRVGYSGGDIDNPTYRNIADHTEVIDIDFDPTKTDFKQLLELFWNNHEYGLATRIKRQYASIIFYHNEEQKRIAEQSRQDEQIKRSSETIITEIMAAKTFYPAEDYHQKYRLQGHKDFAKEIGLTSKLLHSSHIAARLNGYLVGVGGIEQFLKEADYLGLNEGQKDYVKKYIEKHEGGGLYC